MKEMPSEGSEGKPKTDYELHNKYSRIGAAAQFEGDQDRTPTFGGNVPRVRGGQKRLTPVVVQAGFPDELGQTTHQFQTLTRRKLKKLTPIEEETRMSSERQIDDETAKRARAQRFAIKSNYARRKPK